MGHIKTKQEARDIMAVGIQKLAEVVGSTLGPDGKVVFYERPPPLSPIATKDGVSVAILTHFEDPHENMGADVVKSASSKTAQDAGDGTTTSTLFANYLIQNGIKAIKSGANSRHLGNGINKGAKDVARFLTANARIITNDDPLIKSVAMVSSNYDEEASQMIADVIKDIGKEGVIKIIQSLGTKTSMEHIASGFNIKSSMLHPSFITNYERGSCEYRNVAFIIADYEISQFAELNMAFGPIYAKNQIERRKDYDNVNEEPYEIIRADAYLFMSKAMIGEALQSLIKSRETKAAPFVAVKPPWSSDLADVLEDIAVMVGASVVGEEKGFSLKEGNPHQYVGWAESIVVNSQGLTIIGGAGKKEDIEKRIIYLRRKIDGTDHPSTIKEYEQRIATLKNGVAQITVGGENESIMKEKAYRIEDATEAVKASLEEGVTVGGGISFIRALESLNHLKGKNTDEQKGINMVKGALLVPIYTILENSGYTKWEQKVIVGEIMGKDNWMHKLMKWVTKINDEIPDRMENLGFNARTKVFEDLFAAGVIDPVKVDRVAIENAASTTQQFLNTGAIIALLDEAGKSSATAR